MKPTLLLLAMLLPITGCKQDGKGGPAGGEALASYSVRGTFQGYDRGANMASIQHEAIPDFVNREGKKTGMASMRMSFLLAKGVSAEGLAPGDPIDFAFTVDWKRTPPVELTRLDKRAAAPAAAPPAAQPAAAPHPAAH